MIVAIAALLALAAWARLAWLFRRIQRSVDDLARAELPAPAAWPRVSAVVPSRDEERGVERAMRSLLAQDYPALEVVAVDDRSRDATGAILDRLAAEDPRLSVAHVRELPAGWLGKNHACEAGGRRATGDWLLFTDADVVFAPGALRRAVAYAERHRLGHLVALPRLVAPGLLERAFVTSFAALAAFGFRAWELREPGTAAYIGVGAFNLVRADAWRAVGGHRALALEVADDVKLGLVLRRSGVPQGAVDASALVEVRWQAGLAASLRGLVKNAFAGCEYRWSVALAVAAALLLASGVPALAVVLGPAPARAAGAAAIALAAALHGGVARRFGGRSGAEGLLFAPCALALAAVFLASAAVTTARGAVVWRGTRYPLAALRAGCVRARAWPRNRAAGWPERC